MKPKEFHLCANCAKNYRDALHLREAPQQRQRAEKDPCYFCGRICYGTVFLTETQNPTKRKE